MFITDRLLGKGYFILIFAWFDSTAQGKSCPLPKIIQNFCHSFYFADKKMCFGHLVKLFLFTFYLFLEVFSFFFFFLLF